MNDESLLVNIKRTLHLSYAVLILGGITLAAVALTGEHRAILGGAVGWGCGVGTALYACATKLIEMLERKEHATL